MKKFLEGRKTFLGIIVILVGMFGLTNFITPDETEIAFNSIIELVGVIITVYGRVVAKPVK